MKTLALASIAVLACGFALAAPPTPQYGTPEEARAMLTKAVAEVRKDKAAALEKFNKGEAGFKDRKDKNGKAFGEEIVKVAEAGKFKQVSYMWPKPGQAEPAQKLTYVTREGDQICGVGYYR